MKVFIVLTSLLAIALASHQQHYPINIPVIGKTGVPLESAEIVHARHAHLSHVAAVKSQQGEYYGNYGVYAGGYPAAGLAHSGIHLPVIGHGGVPIDTPEVQAAKAAHFAAHAKALSGYGHYRKRRSILGGYAAGQYGGHYGGYAAAHSYPQLGHDGQPIETPEVQALKHQHFAAHAEARSRIGSGHLYGGYGEDYNYAGGYDGHYAGGYGGHDAGYGYGKYHGPIHIPVIGPKGVPIDTPEVQHAKLQHYAALAKAASHASLEYGHHY